MEEEEGGGGGIDGGIKGLDETQGGVGFFLVEKSSLRIFPSLRGQDLKQWSGDTQPRHPLKSLGKQLVYLLVGFSRFVFPSVPATSGLSSRVVVP